MATNYYAVLSMSQDATTDQIRERFMQLARERHPDRFHGSEKEQAEVDFQAITEAFNVLSNPERRRQHDQELARPETQKGVDSAQVAKRYVQRGVKAFKDKNYFEAAENFDRATQEDPHNAVAWHHLAVVCSQQERWLSRATKAIAKACELDPMNGAYHKLAGRLFAEAGLRLRAERYYRQALQWSGEDREVLQALNELKSKGA